MAGYAVLARIDRVDPRFADHAPASILVPSLPEPLEPPEAIELAGRPLVPRLTERWTDLRETWSQTTFYLFHPEGWR